MKPIRVILIASAMAILGGCVAVPVDPGYYGQSYGYYGPAPAYYPPAPAYYGYPYYGPAIGIGVYGGSRPYYYGGRHYYGHGYRYGGRPGY